MPRQGYHCGGLCTTSKPSPALEGSCRKELPARWLRRSSSKIAGCPRRQEEHPRLAFRAPRGGGLNRRALHCSSALSCSCRLVPHWTANSKSPSTTLASKNAPPWRRLTSALAFLMALIAFLGPAPAAAAALLPLEPVELSPLALSSSGDS